MSYKKKILLSGGGTGGSVTPLLAIAEELGRASESGDYNFLWLGTRSGIEQGMVERAGIAFRWIHAGKLRRYFDWRNFIDPFLIIAGFFESLTVIYRWKPALIISAGAFVGVPVVWAGWLLRVPVMLHQQDARPGLANRLMAPFARVVTVTLEKSLADFGAKAVWTGNPVRQSLKLETHNLKLETHDRPTILIMGGGTGARFINELVIKSLDELIKFCDIIHITGRNRFQVSGFRFQGQGYKSFEFLNADEIAEVFSRADLVVTRAGMATMTELASFAKPTIIIPLPASHQEDNAQIFHEAKAAIVLKQDDLTPELFTEFIKKALDDKQLLTELRANISQIIKKDAAQSIVKLISILLNR